MTFISSPSNPRIRALQHLHSAAGRRKVGRILMEGPHLLEALLEAQLVPHEVYYQPEILQRTIDGQKILERLRQVAASGQGQLIEVSERVIEAISEVQTAQGVVCVLNLEAFAPQRARMRRVVRERPGLLILDALADPGNMGTILRTALAADVDSVLLTANCVDYFGPKVVRAAAGAHIALPVEANLSWSKIEERLVAHCATEMRVLLAEAGGTQYYYEQDFRRPFGLVIGNEAHGPSREARAMATLSVTIPLANQVESLNAAMAAGIILYEGVRQMGISSTG